MQIEEVQRIWDKLPKGSKKVFSVIHRMDKKYDGDVFFEIDSLVKWSKVSERTVFYSLKRLRALGWISHLNRPYQCNIYFIMDALRSYKFTFSRVKIAGGLQPINKIADSSSSYVQRKSPSAPISASPNVPISSNKEEEQKKKWFFSLPIGLQLKCMWESFDYKHYGWIFRKLSEQKIYELINNFTWYSRQEKVEEHAKLIFSLALKLYKGKKICPL